MIKSLKVVNSYGEELTMTLNNPRESGYAITGSAGLEPVNVDIKQTQMVSGLKYKYNKGFHKYRQIQISIIYDEWNQKNIDELRQKLYKYFKTNDLVTLYFEKDISSDDPKWYIICDEDPGPREIYFYTIDGSQSSSQGSIYFEAPSADNMYLYLNDEDYDNTLTGQIADEGGNYINVGLDSEGRLYGDKQNITQIDRGYGLMMNVYTEPIPDIKAIQGWVDQHNSVYFSNNCGVTISIICPDPWFRKTDIAYTDNVNLTITNNGQQDSDGLYVYEATINYRGNIQTGIKIDFSNDIIQNLGSHLDIFSNHLESETGELIINIPGLYSPGADEHNLEINTIGDSLSVRAQSIQSEDDYDNVIGWVDANSISMRKNLPALYPGNNTIIVKSTQLLEDPLGNVGKVYYNTLTRGL